MYPKLFIFYLIRKIVTIDIINHFNKQSKKRKLGYVTRKHFWIENEFMNILSKDWLNIIINFKLGIIFYTYRHHQERHNVEEHEVNHVQQLGVEHLTVQDTYLLLLPVLRVDVLNGLAENKLGRGVNCRCNPNCDNDHLQKKNTHWRFVLSARLPNTQTIC